MYPRIAGAYFAQKLTLERGPALDFLVSSTANNNGRLNAAQVAAARFVAALATQHGAFWPVPPVQ